MAPAKLTISSKNYSAWSLRGWLLCRMAGLEFEEVLVDVDDQASRQEILLLSPSFLVPRLTHGPVTVWATMAIAEYLNETFPDAGLWPDDVVARAHCRAVSGEVMSGFYNLRSALPMNLRVRHDSFHVFTGARPDIARIEEIWTHCLDTYGGPYLFGARPTVADAMHAPICTRFRTYGIEVPDSADGYCDTILSWSLLEEWIASAKDEPHEIPELEAEF
jgi:glutathione S-transferase